MKRILLATVIATSSFAYADSGLYTSLKAGVSDTKFEDYKLDQIFQLLSVLILVR